MMTRGEPCHTTLHQWALQNGFKPYTPVKHQDGRQMELISFPFFEERDGSWIVCVNARMKDDPTTMETICWPNWVLTVLPS